MKEHVIMHRLGQLYKKWYVKSLAKYSNGNRYKFAIIKYLIILADFAELPDMSEHDWTIQVIANQQIVERM
jgi:hypothetical protein